MTTATLNEGLQAANAARTYRAETREYLSSLSRRGALDELADSLEFGVPRQLSGMTVARYLGLCPGVRVVNASKIAMEAKVEPHRKLRVLSEAARQRLAATMRLWPKREPRVRLTNRVPAPPVGDAVAAAVARGERTWAQIARAMEWERSDGRPDTSRVQRRLGVVEYVAHGKRCRHKTINYDIALSLMKAAGLDPTDVGL